MRLFILSKRVEDVKSYNVSLANVKRNISSSDVIVGGKYMSEDNTQLTVEETNEKEQVDIQEVVEQQEGTKQERTFTREDIAKMISAERVKWESERKKAESEAEKLASMNAKEKAEYEAKKQADRIADLEAQLKRRDMEATATTLLAEKGIAATADVIDFVVRDDAEQTLEAINAFSTLVNDLADKKVSEMLKGKTPKKVEQTSTGVITREQFNKMGYKDRNELINSNPELYKQLKG